jgi:radical SAM protein with 4Fe4S-binding SPASM domain
MNIQQQLQQLKSEFEVLAVVDLNEWTEDFDLSRNCLENKCKELHRDAFELNQRLLFIHQHDFYNDRPVGVILENLQLILNFVDISNFFVTLVTTNTNIHQELAEISKINKDHNTINVVLIEGTFDTKILKDYSLKKATYRYGSSDPTKIDLKSLSERERFLLTKSKTFCMYPWIHLHAYPTGAVYSCCHSEMATGEIGSCRKQPLAEIWNGSKQRQLRLDMLNEQHNPDCRRCYEQEKSGFFSGRQSANKHHGHQIDRIHNTQNNGHVEQFEMTYWDIRFSNLCNLKCRSCGHTFSSQWFQDQAKLAGGDWKQKNTVLNYAGRTETDMWEQLIPHLDYVEQIYFAGGEPLLMEEHYNILEELVKRGRFDVRLIYNTNFTHTDLKGRSVFDYWKQFESVSVGASLDGMGHPAEYIRKGTHWPDVVKNRYKMIQVCPEVDFYISPTLSIMNAWHVPDFHKEWVSHGLIQAQDLNVNILQDPAYYRIDIAPQEYKQRLEVKYREHLDWMSDRDPLQRATHGFESAIAFMNATDNTQLIDTFWRKTHELDSIRNESWQHALPELRALK